MGTYTTNYNLFMPTVGEQGWGTLVNTNFSTIDTTMGNLNTRLTAVESEVNGALSCTSVTTSGKVTANGGVGTTSLTTSSTITSTGLITANGGVKGGAISGTTGTFSGEVKGTKFTRSTNISVSSTTPTSSNQNPAIGYTYVCILPPSYKPYNGTINFRMRSDYSSSMTLHYITSLSATTNSSMTLDKGANYVYTLTLTNANCLYAYDSTGSSAMNLIRFGDITLS